MPSVRSPFYFSEVQRDRLIAGDVHQFQFLVALARDRHLHLASGQKSRVEGFTAGPLGRIVTIARKDRGVTWTLYLDTNQYTETSLAASSKPRRRSK
jgi:hypothetical protein